MKIRWILHGIRKILEHVSLVISKDPFEVEKERLSHLSISKLQVVHHGKGDFFDGKRL